MIIKGAPREIVKTCKALHEETNYQVRIHKGLSSIYQADKGLREGCPSSPPLFKLYHHAVLEDYRISHITQPELNGNSVRNSNEGMERKNTPVPNNGITPTSDT